MEQIINMIMRQLTRRFVNMGIDKGLNSISNKMKRPDDSDDQTPQR
jgi:hypothetical protein